MAYLRIFCRTAIFLLVAFYSCLSLISVVAADDQPTQTGFAFFEKKVRPILIDRCFECHSEDGAESELQLDSLAGMLRGGMRGPAIVLGKPEKSLLVSAIRHGEILKMPSKEKLPQQQIADIVNWIKMGAPWPNAKPVTATPANPSRSEPEFTEQQLSFWSFQQPIKHALPAVKNPVLIQSPIDTFVLHKLEAAGVDPAPPTDKRTLLRRATFDLLGLPPSPAEIDAFISDKSPEAFSRAIDRLLASPRYGERWGRHWLDIARYADSNGLDENLAHANAFRYRDYVVAAFNNDKPFDRFVQEQLAGDLMTSADDATEVFNRIVATGFLSLGAKMLAEDDPVKMQMDIIDEQLDTIGRAFMGMTLGCARCHDHKFDPISMADYYALAGIFKSTKTMENFNVVARWQERPLATSEVVAARDQHQQRINATQAKFDKIRSKATDEILDEARRHVGHYLLAAWELDLANERLANVKPFGNSNDIASLPNAFLIEAEEFDRGNVMKDRTNYGKGIGVLVNEGKTPNFVEYDVEIREPGTYQFELRLAAAGSRPCKLSINSSTVKRDAASIVTGSWYPETQTWNTEGFYQFKTGKNVIRLEHPQFFPHIDKLLLVKSQDATDDGIETARSELPTSQYQVKSELVKQWSDYLKSVANNPDTPFADWQAGLTKHRAGEISMTEIAKLALRLQEHGIRVQDESELHNDPLRNVLYDEKGPFAKPKDIEHYFTKPITEQLTELRKEKTSLEGSLPKFPQAMAVADSEIEDVRIHIRGDHLTQSHVIARRFPTALSRERMAAIGKDQSGRSELARWLTNPNHPLVARVIVNRVWKWHFGEGLVLSPDNFGQLGQRPTHPMLLDWLAIRFVESGWSIKKLHRQIMLSSTYQMSTTWNEQAAIADPENRLLWRFNRRRLEAEAIRDAILATSGQIDLTMTGSLLPTANRKYVTSTANIDPVVYETSRRSIYLPVVRSALYDVFQVFDFAEPSVLSGQRQSTTVAPQALFMMNSKFVAEQTKAMARGLLELDSVDDGQRVSIAYERALGRIATKREIQRALRFIDRYIETASSQKNKPGEQRQRAWQALCRVVMSTNEFIYVE